MSICPTFPSISDGATSHRCDDPSCRDLTPRKRAELAHFLLSTIGGPSCLIVPRGPLWSSCRFFDPSCTCTSLFIGSQHTDFETINTRVVGDTENDIRIITVRLSRTSRNPTGDGSAHRLFMKHLNSCGPPFLPVCPPVGQRSWRVGPVRPCEGCHEANSHVGLALPPAKIWKITTQKP